MGYRPDEFYAEPSLVVEVLHPDDRGRARELAREGTAKALTADGLFIGQSKEFFAVLHELAEEADEAQRG